MQRAQQVNSKSCKSILAKQSLEWLMCVAAWLVKLPIDKAINADSVRALAYSFGPSSSMRWGPASIEKVSLRLLTYCNLRLPASDLKVLMVNSSCEANHESSALLRCDWLTLDRISVWSLASDSWDLSTRKSPLECVDDHVESSSVFSPRCPEAVLQDCWEASLAFALQLASYGPSASHRVFWGIGSEVPLLTKTLLDCRDETGSWQHLLALEVVAPRRLKQWDTRCGDIPM